VIVPLQSDVVHLVRFSACPLDNPTSCEEIHDSSRTLRIRGQR
jgi:hypothetical protein